MIKLRKNCSYNIQGIKGESYYDCKFIFGPHVVKTIDGQYFQTTFGVSNSYLDKEWWDIDGFKFTEITITPGRKR